MPSTLPLLLRRQLVPFKRRFAWAGIYLLVVVVLGTLGYRWTEGWTWGDALYMSVTTVSAVGFEEVHPLSGPGRAFTMGLIALGLTGLGIWWGLITALIVELDLGGVLRRHRVMRKISEMSGHFIVCGGGRMGKVIIQEMRESGRSFVVVENDSHRAESLRRDFGEEVALIEADATQEHTLASAAVERASGLAACLTNDADNLLLCLTARGLRPDLTIVARAVAEESLDKLRRAGADHVISPNITGGIRMASMLLRPSVVSFLDVATRGADVTLRLEQTEITNESPLAGRSLAEAQIPQRTGLVVLALTRPGAPGDVIYNPGPENRLEARDVIIVLGRQEQVQCLRRYVQTGQP